MRQGATLRGKKVLITGHTGRIGEAIAERFAPVCEMWGLARYSREGSWEEAIARGITPVRGSMGSDSLAELPTDFDYVLNIAAAIHPATTQDGIIDNCDGPARLMGHCRNARAFLHVSTVSVHHYSDDERHIYSEESALGSGIGSAYGVSKLAGEGAVRAGAILLDMPTVICRQNVQYGGAHPDANVFEQVIDRFLETGEVPVPANRKYYCSADYLYDIPDWVEPCLEFAAVPATVVNWCGDEAIDWLELFDYIGWMVGKAPIFVKTDKFPFPNSIQDPSRRQSIAGPARTHWRDGFRRSLEMRHPELSLRT